MGTAIINIHKSRVRLFFTLCIKAFLLLVPSIIIAQPVYDLKIENPVAIAPYKIWQKDQVYGFGGMANVKNLGTKPFVNPKLQLDISSTSSGLLWSDTMSYYDLNIPMSGLFYNNAVDTYKGKYTVYQDSADFNLLDNEVEFEWRISDSIMAKEDVQELSDFKEINADDIWGNIFYINNDTSENGEALVCSSVQIGLANVKQIAINHTTVLISLYKWNNLNQNLIIENSELEVVGGSNIEFTPGEDPDPRIYDIKLYDSKTYEQDVELKANSIYILVVSSFTTALPSPFYVIADSKINYTLNSIKDSITQQYNFGHHVIRGNKESFKLGTYGNLVPVLRMVITPKKYKSYIFGKVFLDYNCDGIYNNQDEPIENQVISEKNSNFQSIKTDDKGNFKIQVYNKGIIDFSSVINKNTTINPSSYIINNDTLGKVFTDKDFGVCFINNYHDLEAILGVPSQPLPGFPNDIDICIKNNGSHYENAKLKLFFTDPNAALYTNYDDTQGGIVTGTTITWDISNLKYLTTICKKVKLKIKSGTPIGTILKPHVQIEYDSSNLDITPFNNETDETLKVTDSVDPFEKLVNKFAFTEKDLAPGIELEYKIHFINMGNFLAENVVVIDTIKYPLDIDKFEMLSASHDYILTINNNIITWTFNNIDLLPYSVDFGYIKFRIKSMENITTKNLISNSAAIYFDNEQPVVTNIAVTKFISSNTYDLDIDLNSITPPRPGFEVKYNVCTTNLGKLENDVKLEFDYKSGLGDLYTQILDTDGGILNGHTVSWNIDSIDFLENVCKTVSVKVLPTTPIGTIFTPHAIVKADTGIMEITLLNNEVTYDEVVVGSYDPNNKTVDKTGLTETQLKEGANLKYIIRFQNTGNFPATFIEVYDTIQGNLDMNSFEMLSASHEYSLTILDDHILKWRFDNINLPDSTKDEPGSHGYIKFRIRTKEDLTKQDVISNTAAIYFDFNQPVFTNTIKTKYLILTPSYNISEEKLNLNVYPNPVSNTLRLEFTLPLRADFNIDLIDPTGKVIETRRYLNSNPGLHKERIDMGAYAPGIYLIRVFTDKYSGELKIIKQ